MLNYMYDALATYNGEVARGLVHTPEYTKEMAKLQEKFNAEMREKLLSQGYVEQEDGSLYKRG